MSWKLPWSLSNTKEQTTLGTTIDVKVGGVYIFHGKTGDPFEKDGDAYAHVLDIKPGFNFRGEPCEWVRYAISVRPDIIRGIFTDERTDMSTFKHMYTREYKK